MAAEPAVFGEEMASEIRVTLEVGPRGKKVVAVAPDWPGLSRGANTAEAAVGRLLDYVPRYEPVAELAGLRTEFPAGAVAKVVEAYPGVGSTDFWGISFKFSSIDWQAMSGEELERELALLRGCWAFFDDVRGRVSAEMQKGPRGGGRDRERIVQHVVGSELDWAKKLGIRVPEGSMLNDEERNAFRDAYCEAIRGLHAEGRMARTWPLRFLIRHTAFHTMDHAWEMEDKDLGGEAG
jgi:hypothetical protein